MVLCNVADFQTKQKLHSLSISLREGSLFRTLFWRNMASRNAFIHLEFDTVALGIIPLLE